MKLKMILAAVVAAAVSAPSLAQPTPLTPEQREARFRAGDKNNDGKLDKTEWVAILPERAKAAADQIWDSRVDTDGDGFVTKEQFMALRMGQGPGGG